jgi:hypothetical protein
MRKAALTGLVFVACGFATNAQLSVTPRVGIEQAFTCVKYNNTSCINPLSANFSPQVGLRADYLISKRHGPFVGVSSNRSLVTYEFTNPETGDKEFTSSHGDWKLRLEAGYQVSSRPISLGRNANAKAAPVKAENPCAARKMMLAQAAAAKKPMMNMRIQPFVGMAFVPDPQTAITSAIRSNETVYQYSAGNWTSAFMTGVNLAFAKGDVNKYVIGVQYLRGIGNMNTETVSTQLDGKTLNTQLSSSASAWNITVGMPLNFTKSKPAVQKAAPQKPAAVAPAVQKVEQKQTPAAAPAEKPVKKSCGYYQKRCGNWQ